MKTKNIIFKVELKGRGVVNFDDAKAQSSMLLNHCDIDKKSYQDPKKGYEIRKNIKVAKKAFSRLAEPIVKTDAEGNVVRIIDTDYKLKIASTCLRNAIFADDTTVQNVKAFLSNPVLAHYVTSTHSLLRGYTVLSKDGSKDGYLTRKGALTITDAIETTGAQIFLECHSNSGPKEKSGDDGSTSLYYTEQVGDTQYEAQGMISLKELQFLSADPFFGRLMIKPEWFEGGSPLITRSFEAHYGSTPFSVGYFTSSTAVLSNRLAEFGIRLNDDFVKFLVREQLKRLLNTKINRAEGVAYTSALKIKFVENGLGSNFDDDEGWITVDASNVDLIDFDMFNFYDESSEEAVIATKGEIDSAEKAEALLKAESNKAKKRGKSKKEE